MKIDKVILASNNNSQYLDFWPLVSEAWKRLDVEPVLIYTGKEKIDLSGNIINFYVEGLDPVFVAQNIRILAPALFPNDNSIKIHGRKLECLCILEFNQNGSFMLCIQIEVWFNVVKFLDQNHFERQQIMLEFN